MSKRRTHHASAARSAPFGTDVQPKLNVKIIGGVAVEIPVDSPPTSAGSSKKSSGTPDLKSGPHGTPPLQTQPQNTDYISKDSRESSHENQRVPPHTGIHPTTSPSDSSNSHIHDQFGRRSSFPSPHKILPPISSPNIHRGPNSDHNSQSDHQPPPYSYPSTAIPPPISSPSHSEITLSEQLRSYLVDYDAYRFKEMYSDLAEFDRKLTGHVTKAQVNMMTLKHQLPVPTTLMRLVLSSFGHDSNPDLVNYEKLIQYLARVQLGTAQAETLIQESVKNWIEFVDYLEKAQPQVKAASKVRIEHTVENSERPTTWPTTKGTERSAGEQTKHRGLPEHVENIPAWERRKPLGRLETRSPKKGISAVEHEITRNDTPSEDRVSPTLPPTTPHGEDQFEVAQLKALARQQRQKRENQQRAAMQNRQVVQRADDDPWFERFMHLARGVYNSDSTNSGFLERDEMFRLIKNYNLIYQLGMTTPRIQNIVTSSTNGVNQVPIEPVLASLRQEKPK